MNSLKAAVRTVTAVRTGAHDRTDAALARLKPVIERVERLAKIATVVGK
jgi:hypothetical protein